jgi:tetratricopeptide (TPR) repeat protein
MSAVNDPTPAAGPPQPTAPDGGAIQATPPPAAATTGIQTEPAPVPLPPRPRLEPITVEELGRAMARLDRMIVALVIVLAALVAVFPVRNSDFWLQLAAARDWLGGKFALGQDPYSYTGTGTWVNHSWLYGLLFYGLYHFLGGPAVIIAKAVLSVILAGLLLSIRRREQSTWIPAACTALAVLALSPRLLMQPAVLSFVLLAATVAVLMRHDLREQPAEDRKRRHGAPVPWLGEPADRPLWLLVPLFALWVNLDSWFVLGPLAVALYLAGRLVQLIFASGQPGSPRPGAWRPLAAVLVAGLAACLLSPFGARGLRLPAEIGAGDLLTILRQDEGFNRILGSPLQREYFTQTSLGLNIAGMAYFPLILVGLLSFALSGSPFRWGRALLWGGFLGLSLVYARAIPFFAIVAGPVAAVNLQEYAARRFGTAPTVAGWRKEWALLGRGLTVLAVFLLALLAWPGWLFGFPQEARRVSLVVEPPPELVKLAAQIEDWRRDGTLTDDDRLLNLQPEVAHALAWLCPEHTEQWFFDARFDNYPPEVAEDYVKLRKAFDPAGDGTGKRKSLADEAGEWRPILDKYKVTLLILYNASPGTFQRQRVRTAQAAPYLVALYLDGHAAAYARRAKPLEPQPNDYLKWLWDRGYSSYLPVQLTPKGPALPPPPEDVGRFKGKEFNPWDQAFGKKAEALPPGKPRPPQPLAWWSRFAFGPGPRSAETDDAAAYLDFVNDASFRFHFENVMLPKAAFSFSGLVCTTALRTGSALGDAFATGVHVRLALDQVPPIEVDEFGPIYFGEAAPVILAIRSARRALLRNPDDAEAYFQLGRAYATLPRQTMERQFGDTLVMLSQLRNVQAISALRNAVLLDPDKGLAHFWLAVLMGRSGFRDLQLKHFTEFVRWSRRMGPLPGESEEQFNERVKGLEDRNKELEKLVKDNQLNYEVRSEKLKVFQKAQMAMRMGLGEKALQVLLESDDLEFGIDGARLELELLLSMGRLEDLREQLWPKDEKLREQREQMPETLNKQMGIGTYERYRFLLAAAEGDYDEADLFLEQARTKTLNDPIQLQRFRRTLELEAVPAGPARDLKPEASTPGPAKDLNVAQLLAVGIARAIAEQMPVDGPVGMQLARRLVRDFRLARMMEIPPPLLLAANYETLRGIMRVEAGDIRGAQQHFREALFADKDKKGRAEDIVVEFPGANAAYRYLRMTEEKD